MSVQVNRRPATPDPNLPQVFGRYLLVQCLSRGGMGEIFLARHGLSGFEKLAVIKKVLPHLSEDSSFISRFIDEAQVAIKLQHANIAQVFEVGRVEDEYFLALEYVDGRDLRRTLGMLHERGRRFPADLALFIAREVASGLAYAHRRTDESGESLELVHCDISPPNVMLSFEGEIKIIDFGIAKSALRGTATDPQMGFGKFGYMAPEQLIRGGKVDHRTDIYACGVVLYELLTGDRMYELGDTPDYKTLARMVARGQHPLPSQHDPALAPYDDLVIRALRPKPEDRYQNAADMRDDIQHALVSITPTISSDNLSDFMRELFAAEMTEQRRLIARVEATDLEPWVELLTTQSSTTVSYALAHMPLPAPENTEIVDPASAPPLPAPSRKRRSRPMRAVVGVALAAVMVGGGGLLAWALGGDDGGSDAETASQAAAPATGGAADDGDLDDTMLMEPDHLARHEPASEPEVESIEPESGEEVTSDEEASEEASGGEAARRPPPRTRPEPRKSARTRPRTNKRSQPEPDRISDQEFNAKFQRLSRDYRRFRQRYGARLESEWTDLATDAQYARGDPGKLRALDRRIDRFRKRMRAARD